MARIIVTPRRSLDGHPGVVRRRLRDDPESDGLRPSSDDESDSGGFMSPSDSSSASESDDDYGKKEGK